MELIGAVNDWIWNPMAYFALAVGLFFTILTGAVQFRRLPDMIRQITEKKNNDDGISSFQALLLTLSSRIGVGNIAGVATALLAGGPGALFWMVVAALVGAASSFAETVLAQVYKRKIDGEHRGGAPFYVEFGLKLRWLAVVLSTLYLLGYGFVFPGVQSNNIASSIEVAFNVPVWLTALGLTALLAFTILGGTRRIVKTAQIMVPVMAVGYIVFAILIIGANLGQVVPTLQMILGAAFGMDQVLGGMAGAAIAWGVRRAVFSNVAGVGEGTFGAAAAAVSHPAKQGLVQAFSIFIDTVVVCTATGVMILITDSFNVEHNGETVIEHVPGVQAGVAYTQEAVNTLFSGFGPAFVAIALFFFAFTALIAFYYIADTNLAYIRRRSGGAAEWVLKIGFLAITFFGSVASADLMWGLGDIGYGLLGWVNMLVILAMTPVVRKVIKDYDEQMRAGVNPVFDPQKLGISGAQHWEEEVAYRSSHLPAEPPSHHGQGS
ncbi:alanine/glycine:cation symporter family protein [Nesterenkonia massiliensis]|uniref:alanine/glycine:cation symporter family protein n=1 Tax=Nesterenkonia massiliensis TaxID=1232429 RepID=UPI0004151A7C|nr:alanine/glycine:cation symporter family protein [Nesterenkonia massiliensis]